MTPEAVVARVFGCDESAISDSSSPETIGEWDSLGHVTLIIELEAQFAASFSPEETVLLTDVGKIKESLRAQGIQW
jgi:acyl carrier protein